MIFYCDTGDHVAAALISVILGEAKKEVDLGQNKKIYFHKAHIPDGQDHLHFYQKGAKLYSLNQDGTAHDRSHGAKMANWAMDAVTANYPNFNLPKDGLIEQMMSEQGNQLLLEADGSSKAPIIPRAVIMSGICEAAR